jgi:hypothetical protein
MCCRHPFAATFDGTQNAAAAAHTCRPLAARPPLPPPPLPPPARNPRTSCKNAGLVSVKAVVCLVIISMVHYGSTPSISPTPTVASARRRNGAAALISVFVVLCCLSYASVQSQLPDRPSSLEAQQQLLAPVAPLKISFDAKIGGADPATHLNTFSLSNVKLAGNAKWKDFANRAPPILNPTNNRKSPMKTPHLFSFAFLCPRDLMHDALQVPRLIRRGRSTITAASLPTSSPIKKGAG